MGMDEKKRNTVVRESKQQEALQSVIDQCDKWIRLAHHKWVDDGKNISIHVTIENHYHGTIDHLTINGD